MPYCCLSTSFAGGGIRRTRALAPGFRPASRVCTWGASLHDDAVACLRSNHEFASPAERLGAVDGARVDPAYADCTAAECGRERDAAAHRSDVQPSVPLPDLRHVSPIYHTYQVLP
jgi:hypothetical protein